MSQIPTCNCGPIPGVLAATDTEHGINRCDECAYYPGDLAAALALAQCVPGGVVRFYQQNLAVYDVWDEGYDDVDKGDPALIEQLNVLTYAGEDLPGVLIAGHTNPWVEVNGEPIDWTTYRLA